MIHTDAPPPDRVAEYLRHRAAIDARWAVADELWDSMTSAERVEAAQALDDDWRPRR